MKSELAEPEEYFQIGQSDPRLVIYLRYPLFKALDDFANRESHREQVGLLVGRQSRRSDGSSFLLIEDAIESPIGDETTGRFEESLWKRARRIAAARHPNRSVVGWFHTHPNQEINVTSEEAGVHKRFFPEDDHVLYRIDPKAKDRQFYYKDGSNLKAANGFCIYGKPQSGDGGGPSAAPSPPVAGAKPAVNEVSASPEQQQRYLEKTLEKMTRRLQRPPVGPKDVLVIALLLVNALLIWFRPNPPVNFDTSNLERGQADLSAQVTSVRDRIEKLEKHLADLQLLDEQLKLAAGLEDVGATTDPLLEEDPLSQPDLGADTKATAEKSPETTALSQGAGKIQLYKVVAGDTLSVISNKFYPEGGTGITSAFARFNRLKAPDFAIFPGDILKVPPAKALEKI